ncbi:MULTISPECIES: NYN domain-containing protein [unclassified Microcoleus]|uniref:NYN domain-containing protein n=1 Tax=unclassified Microcoleus TaxID=2642155 RepID=UPI002FD13BD7
MKNPRRSPDRFRHSPRSRGQQFYQSQAVSQHGFQPQSPLSCEGADSTSSPETAVKCDREIAILLLDAENMKLDINAEKFLASLCSYPLQVKIAFANWKNPSIGKLDTELYDRGYELIHAPGGANTADGKMIAFGAAILYRYRDVREVFVCSSDGLLNHLCNQLQNQGLTVFRVRRQNAILSVENHLTGESNHYSCERKIEIPTFPELANQISELLKTEHQLIDDRIARLSSVVELFQERRALEFTSINSTHIEAFASAQKDMICEPKEPAISDVVGANIEQEKLLETVPANPVTIDSLEVLEKVLIKIIELEINNSPNNAINIAELKKIFFNRCQVQADHIVKTFLVNSSLVKFLKSRSSVFQLTAIGSEHHVKIVRKSSDSNTSPSATLESSLAKILIALTAQSPGAYISTILVAGEFNKQYGQPITKKLKSLDLGEKFIDFLQSCQTFKVKKEGNDYQVAIAPGSSF